METRNRPIAMSTTPHCAASGREIRKTNPNSKRSVVDGQRLVCDDVLISKEVQREDYSIHDDPDTLLSEIHVKQRKETLWWTNQAGRTESSLRSQNSFARLSFLLMCSVSARSDTASNEMAPTR
jgi:hypothetical protein